MFFDFVIGFAEFLNRNSFAVSESAVQRFFTMAKEEDVDIGDEKLILSILKLTFAKNHAERVQMQKLFYQYMEELDHPKPRKKTEKEKKQDEMDTLSSSLAKSEGSLGQLRIDLDHAKSSAGGEIIKIQKERKEKEEELYRQAEKAQIKPLLSDNKAASLKKKIGKIKFPSRETGKAVANLFQHKEADVSSADAGKAEKELMGMAEELLRKGKLVEAQAVMEIQKNVKKITTMQEDFEKKMEANIRRQLSVYDRREREIKDKVSLLQSRLDAENRKYMNNQERVRQLMESIRRMEEQEQKGLLIQKQDSLYHRPEFIGGENAVQCISDNVLPVMEKNFKNLSKKECDEILYYIRRNILAFKTRMTRNIRSDQRKTINMEQTICNAMRTCGLPMKLAYDMPKRSKADLILVLDVSGSCKGASEMMLKFAGLLKSVFPRGCKAFAFVNSLYDISDVYDVSDLDMAVGKALNMIPRRGQYSNYEVPLRTMWKKRKNDITKDSIVIFIGDARNNKNDPGEYFIKNICRKAKHAYWLNTDPYEKWNTGDSQAYIYGKYAKMVKMSTSAELIQFISKLA